MYFCVSVLLQWFVCLCYCSALFSVRDLCDGVISGSASNFDLVHMFTVISDI